MARTPIHFPQQLWNPQPTGLRGIDPLGDSYLWSPALIKPAHWFDASDRSTVVLTSGKISQWRDKSGNGYHASQSNATYRPVYASIGGYDSVAFSNAFFTHSCSINETNMVFAVFTRNSAGSTGTQVLYQAIGSNAAFVTLIQARSSTNANWSTYLNSPVSSSLSMADNKGLACMVNQTPFSNGLAELYSNGKVDFSQVVEGRYGDGGVRCSIGGEGPTYGPTSFFDGNLFEVVVVKSNDPQLRELITGYLAHKWGIAEKLPISHSYKFMPPFITPQYATAFGVNLFNPAWVADTNYLWMNGCG